MFTLIKRLQELLAIMRKNKGIWFTTLSILSISGIFVFMYIVVTMTDTVSSKVYKSMNDTYELNFNAKIANRQDDFKKLAGLLEENKLLTTAIETNDRVALDVLTNDINENFVNNGFLDLSVRFVSLLDKEQVLRNSLNTAISTKRDIYGTEVLENGVFSVYILPLIKENIVYGILEIKESIHSFRNLLVREGSEYIFLLDKKMLSSLSLEQKTGKYKEIDNDFLLKQGQYDTKFATSISNIDTNTFEEFLEIGYILDNGYFRVAKKLTDINGVEIGLIITGKKIEETGGFVNIAGDMTNSVTTAALGLVISIILFLF